MSELETIVEKTNAGTIFHIEPKQKSLYKTINLPVNKDAYWCCEYCNKKCYEKGAYERIDAGHESEEWKTKYGKGSDE